MRPPSTKIHTKIYTVTHIHMHQEENYVSYGSPLPQQQWRRLPHPAPRPLPRAIDRLLMAVAYRRCLHIELPPMKTKQRGAFVLYPALFRLAKYILCTSVVQTPFLRLNPSLFNEAHVGASSVGTKQDVPTGLTI